MVTFDLAPSKHSPNARAKWKINLAKAINHANTQTSARKTRRRGFNSTRVQEKALWCDGRALIAVSSQCTRVTRHNPFASLKMITETLTNDHKFPDWGTEESLEKGRRGSRADKNNEAERKPQGNWACISSNPQEELEEKCLMALYNKTSVGQRCRNSSKWIISWFPRRRRHCVIFGQLLSMARLTVYPHKWPEWTSSVVAFRTSHSESRFCNLWSCTDWLFMPVVKHR